MNREPITANPSEVIIEQLAASGVRYVFNNSGSREARFFDALHSHPDLHGILALHEGSVTSIAGGYTQAQLEPAVMVVHLGAGLAQSLGQLINVWQGSLPVVVVTFAGDTGGFYDKVGLDLDHSFGPTSISAPFMKSSWAVIEPESLPVAIDRALRVATTPPVGPVHLAVYDRVLGPEKVSTDILEGGSYNLRAGYPDDAELEELDRALREADRPLMFVGDGVWKSGAQTLVASLAERLGIPVAGDVRSFPIKHPLHCGSIRGAAAALDPDTMVCIGVHHSGGGFPEGYAPSSLARRIIAIGPDVQSFKNIQDLDTAILADERRTLERLQELSSGRTVQTGYAERRRWALEQAASLRAQRLRTAQDVQQQASRVRPLALAEALDTALERRGGGLITMEQFAVPIDAIGGSNGPGRNVYLSAAGGSEGYGVGGAIGLKLGSPDKHVVGLVGDGSLFYAESGLWTAAHHGIPVLYVIPNNQSYGIVANSFARAGGNMKDTGEYAGVVLGGIDPAKIAEGFGVEAITVSDESRLSEAIENGLSVIENEERPFLLNVRLPLGLPPGGRAAAQFRLSGTAAKTRAAA